MKQKINWFYSNCLLEAIKAKIKAPKYIHIFFVKPHHFMWHDIRDDMVYDFYQKDTFNRWYQILWYEGCIYHCKYGTYKRWRQSMKTGRENDKRRKRNNI